MTAGVEWRSSRLAPVERPALVTVRRRESPPTPPSIPRLWAKRAPRPGHRARPAAKSKPSASRPLVDGRHADNAVPHRLCRQKGRNVRPSAVHPFSQLGQPRLVTAVPSPANSPPAWRFLRMSDRPISGPRSLHAVPAPTRPGSGRLLAAIELVIDGGEPNCGRRHFALAPPPPNCGRWRQRRIADHAIQPGQYSRGRRRLPRRWDQRRRERGPHRCRATAAHTGEAGACCR